MKIFKDTSPEQLFLLPPSIDDFVPVDAPARILSEIMDQLDTGVLISRYKGGGAPAYNPLIMLKLLVFSYGQGMHSSRRLAAACGYDLRFMYLAQLQRPDFHTICRFRKENEAAIKALFKETVILCQTVGLVLLEHVAVDGTKIEADVSGKATYKKDRLNKELAEIEAQITQILAKADATDAEEDRVHHDGDGDQTPDDLKDKQQRIVRLAAAKERLEAAKKSIEGTERETVAITDADSRVMKTRAGNRPAYNAQAAVDGAHHVIVAADVTQDINDTQQFGPMVDATVANTGFMPAHMTADAGYCSPETMGFADRHGVDAYVAERPEYASRAGYEYDPENDCFRGVIEDNKDHVLQFWAMKTKRGRVYRVYRDAVARKERWCREHPTVEAAGQAKMHEKMNSPEGKAIYRQRQHVVEPVFGHIKGSLNLRRLHLRGLTGAKIEFLIACCAHNIGKIVTMRRNSGQFAYNPS